MLHPQKYDSSWLIHNDIEPIIQSPQSQWSNPETYGALSRASVTTDNVISNSKHNKMCSYVIEYTLSYISICEFTLNKQHPNTYVSKKKYTTKSLELFKEYAPTRRTAWWRHETLFALLALCVGLGLDYSHKSPVKQNFDDFVRN